LKLLPKQELLKTGPVDHADWNYKPLTGLVQRRRFRMALRLLGKSRFERLLEIGYGSGIFMPELSGRCDELHGIDIHNSPGEVESRLMRNGTKAELKSCSATAMSFPDAFFDCVLAVSSLEFVDDLERACCEVRRVLREDGAFIVVTPGQSAVLDAGLKLLTGESAHADFGERRSRILPTLERMFVVERRVQSPILFHRIVNLYTALLMRPR
jgi:ubiquinone/menaquinone biosynthesis C-methylase UbiE